MALDREILGEGACNGCGSAVQVKLNKNGRAYYFCNSCGHNERFGSNNTEKLRKQLNGQHEESKANESGTGTIGKQPEPEEQPRKPKSLAEEFLG